MKVLLLVVCSMMLQSCLSQKVVFNSKHPPTSHPVHKSYNHFFIEGVFQEKELDISNFCGGFDKIHSLRVRKSLWNVAADFFAGIYYKPREVSIFCTNIRE